jgi:hypothetical protein
MNNSSHLSKRDHETKKIKKNHNNKRLNKRDCGKLSILWNNLFISFNKHKLHQYNYSTQYMMLCYDRKII